MEDVIAKKKPKVSPAGRRKKGLAFERVAAARLSKIRGVVAKRIPLNSPNAAIINCDLDINFRGARFTAECKAGGHAPSIDRYIGKNNFVISKRDNESAYISMTMDMFVDLCNFLIPDQGGQE